MARTLVGCCALAVVLAIGSTGATAAGAAKRGIASSRYLSSDPAVLSRLGASWAYDWSSAAPPPGGPEWVPMIWGSGSLKPGVVAALRADGRAGRAHDLLGFNEPDLASQANLTPARAANLWPQLERTGLRLGSPAPASPNDGWLAHFMALARARHLRVDFIALHVYQDFTSSSAVSDLRSELVRIHDTYRKPIWITELGAIDIRAWHEPMKRPPTQALADSYMHRVFAMLDALPFVERYAWFTDDCSNDAACRYSSLFAGGGKLTPAGSTFEHAR